MNSQQDSSISDSVWESANSLGSVSPVKVAIRDGSGVAVMYIDDAASSKLVISLTNQTDTQLTIAAASGEPNSENATVRLKLPDTQFYFYTAPAIEDAASTPGAWRLATNAASRGGWIDTIYLANTQDVTLSAHNETGDTLKLVITYGGAVPDDPRTVKVPAQVSYRNMRTADNETLQGSSLPQTLDLIDKESKPIPLIGAFIGPRTVLNDGITARDLTLRLINSSLTSIPFIAPPSGQATQSCIEVALPVSDVDSAAAWALCGTAAWESVEPSLSGSAASGWRAAKGSTPGVIVLRPDFEDVQSIPPAGTFDLLLKGVTSALQPGIVQVQIFLKRFALYGTQTFGVALEKTPLVYATGTGSAMTLSNGSGGSSLASSDTSDSALIIGGDSQDGLLKVAQQGSGPALSISGSGDAVTLDVQGDASIAGALGLQTLPDDKGSHIAGGRGARIDFLSGGRAEGKRKPANVSIQEEFGLRLYALGDDRSVQVFSDSTKVNGDITVDGETTLKGAATLNGSATFSGAASFAELATFNGASSFAGPATFNVATSFTGPATLKDTATFSGGATFTDGAHFKGTTTFNTALELQAVPDSVGSHTGGLGSRIDFLSGGKTSGENTTANVSIQEESGLQLYSLGAGRSVQVHSPSMTVNGTFTSQLDNGHTIKFTFVGDGYLGLDIAGNHYGLKELFLSSKAYKENIQDLDLESSDVFSLRPVKFDWKDKSKKKSFGLIAEEVAELFPELVLLEEKTGRPHSVNYELLSVMLLNELKKLRTETKERLSQLECQVSALNEKLEAIQAKTETSSH